MSNKTGNHAWRVSLAAATIISAGALPMAAMAQSSSTNGDWWTTRGDPQGTAYSVLNEINAGNVANLVEEFKVPTHTYQNHEGSPLVVGNVMYAETPWPNKLIAINMANGHKVLWTYNPGTDPGARAQSCCDYDNRGPAYVSPSQGGGSDGELIFNSLDNNVHAVDALTGKRIWMTNLGSRFNGQTMTGAPIIADGIAMVGNSGAELGVRGAVYGLNVTTGAVVWTGYNTGPDSDVLIGPGFHAFYKKDQGTNLGVTTWNGSNWWTQGGATAWGFKTYDPVNDLFIYGTGNADPWSATYRGGQGDAKWAATIIARKPATGAAVWATQLTPDDQWDFDSIEESVVADITINGVSKHVLIHVDKNGYGYTLDAATGQILVVGDATGALNGGTSYLNWSSGVDLKTGKPQVVPSHVLHGIENLANNPPTNYIAQNCPGPGGLKDQEPISFSILTGLAYIPAHNGCLAIGAIQDNWIPGTSFIAESFGGAKSPGANGGLIAWNPATGTPAWTVIEPYALWSGVMTTAGNLVMYGTLSNGTDNPQSPTLKILNATTGALLWSAALECNSVGNPMTFIGADGHQRIATFTGTGGTGAEGTGKCPNIEQFNPARFDQAKTMTWLHQEIPVKKPGAPTPTTGYIHVFKLP